MEQRKSCQLYRGVMAGIMMLVLVVGCRTQTETRSTQTPTPIPTQTATLTPTQTDSPTPTQPVSPTPTTTVGEAGTEPKAEIYLLQAKGEKAELVARSITLEKSVGKEPSAILKQAFQRLLTEPQVGGTNASSAIPPGTKLLNLTVKENNVSVDLSKEFMTGGGSASMQGRLGQVIYTATSLNPQAKVFLYIEGKKIESLGGEGLVIDQPITRQIYNQDFQL